VSALGKPTAEALREVFRNRFSKKSVVCTDGDRAYVKYAKRRGLEHFKVKNGTAVRGPYHVQNINAYHSRLKHFIARFKGVATKYLNNYLVWNNVIQEGARSRITLLKLAVKAVLFDRWSDVSRRSALPVPI
jgi:IS1 family transposase